MIVAPFGEPRDPNCSSVKAQLGLVVFGSDRPSTQTKLKSAVRQEVNGCSLSRNKHGVPKIVIQHSCADPQMRSRLRRADDRGKWRQEVDEMIGQGQGAVAKRFDPAGFLLPFGARLGGSNIYAEAEKVHLNAPYRPLRRPR